jgi:hypothetical protein
MRQWHDNDDDDVMKDGVVDMDGTTHFLLHEDGKDNYVVDDHEVEEVVEEDSVDNTGREDDGSTPMHGAAVDTMMKDSTTVAAVGKPKLLHSLPLQLMLEDVANRPTTTKTGYLEYHSLLYYHQHHLVQGTSTMMVIMMSDAHQFHQQHQYC